MNVLGWRKIHSGKYMDTRTSEWGTRYMYLMLLSCLITQLLAIVFNICPHISDSFTSYYRPEFLFGIILLWSKELPLMFTAGLLVINSTSFLFVLNLRCLYILRYNFAGYKNLGWKKYFFSFNTLKLFNFCLRIFIVYDEKFIYFLTLVLYVNNHVCNVPF